MSPPLSQAAADLRYLLARGYPRPASLTLVGNHYTLGQTDRELLHRGVFAPVFAAARRAKLRLLADLKGRPLAIDGHNVLITLQCALKGLPLVAADDGFIRDAARLSRAFRPNPAINQALALLARHLSQAQPGPLTVLFDAPMRKSGELARETRTLLEQFGLQAEAAAVSVPERQLLGFPSPIATSDTHLIDAHPEIIDLAGEIIRLLPDCRIISWS
jgi:hypothetical protein